MAVCYRRTTSVTHNRVAVVVPGIAALACSKGRLSEADKVVTQIEDEVSQGGKNPLPPLPAISTELIKKGSWTELFKKPHLPRLIMVSVLWVCAYLVTYGLLVWLPTIFTRVYNLPVQQALNYSLFANAAGLVSFLACAFVVDGWAGG